MADDAHDDTPHGTVGSDESAWSSTPDWVFPSSARHPRLEGALQARLVDISWATLDRLVNDRAAEDGSLDVKGEMYDLDRDILRDQPAGTELLARSKSKAHDEESASEAKAATDEVTRILAKGRTDLGKDVTALANAGGGMIILGIAEHNGAAAAFRPTRLSDKRRVLMRSMLQSHVAPAVPDVAIGHIVAPPSLVERMVDQADISAWHGDWGCVLIFVPPSTDAPHAVVTPNEWAHTYFRRDGARNQPLSEALVATAYRDRFTSRSDVDERVREIYNEGRSTLDPSAPWLVVAVTPSRRAPSRALNAALRDEYKAATYARQDAVPGARFGQHVVFGRRRIVLRDTDPSVPTESYHLLHLHTDGSAFGSVKLRLTDASGRQAILQRRHDLSADTACIQSGSVMMWVLSLLGITIGHVVDSGAGGDLEVVCGIAGAVSSDRVAPTWLPGMPPDPAALAHILTEYYDRSFERMLPSSAVVLSPTPTQVTTTPVIASDPGELVSLASQVSSDIMGEFGQVPTDQLLRADGRVEDIIAGQAVSSIVEWAAQRGLLV
ncbi:ATP-binding protein [Nocardioides sp.]|uniref:AlbA family DNA-binding domain-containing protein n=1 Tax=Nocardioides sp. TaxID=35761 RepID=UPI00321BFF06